MIKNNLFLTFLLITSINIYCQVRYEFNGYYIKTGNVISTNDSIIKYEIYNCIFIPQKKISLKKIKRISNKNINMLNYYGNIYNLLPVRYNKFYLNKIYDSLSTVKMLKNSNINFNSLRYRPSNFVDFNIVNEIKFNGIFKVFNQEQLFFLFPEYKIKDRLPEEIIINKITFDSKDGKISEKQIKKKMYLYFRLYPKSKTENVIYETIMIYDCKLPENSVDM